MMFLKHNHFLPTTSHGSALPIAAYLRQGPVEPRAAGACTRICMTCLPGVEEILEETK